MSPKEAATAEAVKLVGKLNDAIFFPLIALLSGVAFLVFIIGCVQYVLNASNESAREEGKKHITYGVIGLVVMVSAFAILKIAAGTFGLQEQYDCAKDPTASGCDSAFQMR